MAQRPTPRNGWTAVSHASAEGESARGSPLLKRAPSSGQSTVSFAHLPPLSANARFAGRAVESTQDVSLQDMSFGDMRRAGSVDKTQDVSLSDISVTEMEARGSARQARATGPGAGSEAADLAMRKWRRQSAGIAVGALVAVGSICWFAVSGGRTSDQASKPRATALVTDAPPASAEHESRPGSAAPALVPVPPGPSPALVGEKLPGAAPAEQAQAADAPEAQAAEGPAREPAPASSEPAANAASPGGTNGAAQPDGSAVDAAREVAAGRASALVDQAQALQKRKKYAAAKARYREALNVSPDHPRALAGLVQLAIRDRDGKQAVSLAKQLVQAEPDDVAHLVLLGDAYKSARKRKEAREAWQTAARAGSAVARARLKR